MLESETRRGDVGAHRGRHRASPPDPVRFSRRLESPQPHTGDEKRLHSEDSSGYLAGSSATTRQLVADDFHLEAGARTGNRLSLFSSPCARPQKLCLSWTKTAGGDVVGIKVLRCTHELGIPERKAEWLIGCTRGIAKERDINLSHLEKGICRLMYVARDFESLHPRGCPTSSVVCPTLLQLLGWSSRETSPFSLCS